MSKEKWSAFLLLGLAITCTVLNIRISVELNEFSRDFYNALAALDQPAITTALKHFVIIVTLLIITAGGSYYFNNLLSARWRRWLTDDYLNRWLAQHAHYRMQLSPHYVDNPDQRISEDLNALPELTLSVFFVFFQAILTLAMFGTLLWQLAGSLPIQLGAYSLKGYIFWSALIFGIFGTSTVRWIGKKLVHLDYQQQYYAASFRYSLIRLRETSEQIAFYKGEASVKERCMQQFRNIFSNTLAILSLRMNLAFFTTGYNNLALTLGLFLAIPLYLSKKVLLGGLMQISSAFGHTVNAFTSLVNSYSLFANWRAVILRLGELNACIQSATHLPTQINIVKSEEDQITAKNLTVTLPNGKMLMEDVHLSFNPNERILITGASGSGKSTLLRVFAGLWPYGSGCIYFPHHKTVLFLPQKPYLPIGSIKDILLFSANTTATDDELLTILAKCGLQRLQSHLYEQQHWSQRLSLGEQQLLAFAQTLIQKPDILFLDEATSALDEKNETTIYRHLQELLPNSIIISVGHRRSLYPHHDKILILSQQQLSPLVEFAAIA